MCDSQRMSRNVTHSNFHFHSWIQWFMDSVVHEFSGSVLQARPPKSTKVLSSSKLTLYNESIHGPWPGVRSIIMECINNAVFALHYPMRRDLHYHYVMLGRSHGALQCIIMQFVLGVGIDTPGWLGCCLLHQLHGQLNLNFTRSLKGEKGKAQCIPSCMDCISSRPSQSEVEM